LENNFGIANNSSAKVVVNQYKTMNILAWTTIPIYVNLDFEKSMIDKNRISS